MNPTDPNADTPAPSTAGEAATGPAAAPIPVPPTGPTMTEMFGPGGLEGLMNQLHAAGYAPHVNSWVSTGPNQAINAQALSAAMRPETVAQIAAATGMAPQAIGQFMSTALPAMVNHFSPLGTWTPFSSGNRMQEFAQLGVLLGGLFMGSHAGSVPNWQAMLNGMGGANLTGLAGLTPTSPTGPTPGSTISSDLGTITIPPTNPNPLTDKP
jgi:uncharacterized protein YidB (DUF937 family)